MLLNEELIDKLMSNKTLVNLMYNQLKRVIDTDDIETNDRERLVRQVFDSMMEKKVDFSMNNVRLAVKTVSSSYRSTAAKQRSGQLTSKSRSQQVAKASASSGQPSPPASEKKEGKILTMAQRRRRNKIETKGFGLRAAGSGPTTARSSELNSSSAKSSTTSSRSLDAIDTALKLTGRVGGNGKKSAASQEVLSGSVVKRMGDKSLGAARVDASGNPIVVVLLPQDRA